MCISWRKDMRVVQFAAGNTKNNQNTSSVFYTGNHKCKVYGNNLFRTSTRPCISIHPSTYFRQSLLFKVSFRSANSFDVSTFSFDILSSSSRIFSNIFSCSKITSLSSRSLSSCSWIGPTISSSSLSFDRYFSSCS